MHLWHPIQRVLSLLLVVSALPLVPATGRAQVARPGRRIVDDMVIRRSVQLRPGVYHIRDVTGDGVIQIRGDDITLDGTGVTLIGEDFQGIGLAMNGHKNLTLRNFHIRGFRYGIQIENASQVVIRNSDISGNFKDTSTSFLHIRDGGLYGGGILFRNVHDSLVAHNVLTHQSTGLEMIGSDDNRVLDNTTSSGPEGNETAQNSCWGVRLDGSSRNLVRGNVADFVDRRRYGLVSGDSAGILLVNGSHDNRIVSNSMTHSGDGFFLGNGCEVASHRNYVWGNDGSHSPHNAFESTFSDSNVFERNRADASDYGFWLGYSYNSRVARNQIVGNLSAGVASEQGHDNEMVFNLMEQNPFGVRLWGPRVCSGADNCGQPCPSRGYRMAGNSIAQGPKGILATETDSVEIVRNVIAQHWRGFEAANLSSGIGFTHNVLVCDNPLDDPENLAFGRTATSMPDNGTAGRAVDGVVYDLASSWVPPTLGSGDYWQVDLGSQVTVAEVAIFPFFGNLHDFPYQYHLDLSATGAFLGDEIRLATETDRIRVPIAVHSFPPQVGRYLRLVSDEAMPRPWIQMMELAVYSHPGHYPHPCVYSIYNGLTADLPAPRNDWGTTRATDIEAVVFDHDDDPAVGQVVFQPPLAGSPSDPTIERGPEIGAWSTTRSLPQPSSAPFLDRGRQLVLHDRWLYLVGGHGAGEPRLTEVHRAAVLPDGSLGPWTATTPIPQPVYDHVVVHSGGRLYLLAGAAGDTAVFTAAIGPDGSLGAWTPTTSLLPSRQSFAAVAWGSHVYATGGNSGGTRDFVQRATVQSDGTLGPWISLDPLPEPIQGHAMVAYGGFLYVLAPGGKVYRAPVEDGGALGQWRATSPLPASLAGPAAFEHGGRLYAVDGTSTGVYHAEVLPDGQLGSWQTTTGLPTALRARRVGAYGDHVYALGGFDGTSFYDTSLVARLDVPAGCDGGEVLVAAFQNGPDAASSTLDYQGFATLTVSGVGQASAGDFSDAFYVFATADGKPIELPWHSSAPYNWVLAINGQHVETFTPDGTIPAYRPDHRYTVSIRAPAGPLHFGVADVGVGDNTGFYEIGLCGGTPPEPTPQSTSAPSKPGRRSPRRAPPDGGGL